MFLSPVGFSKYCKKGLFNNLLVYQSVREVYIKKSWYLYIYK